MADEYRVQRPATVAVRLHERTGRRAYAVPRGPDQPVEGEASPALALRQLRNRHPDLAVKVSKWTVEPAHAADPVPGTQLRGPRHGLQHDVQPVRNTQRAVQHAR